MAKPTSTLIIDTQDLERRIFVVRGQRVMLDAHLAKLYGVATRALNQAVARKAFVRMRRLMATPGDLVQQPNELAKTVQLHDGQIAEIAEVLRRLMEPPPGPPKRRIGFHSDPQSAHAANGHNRGEIR